eukprot:SAG22_NODE_1108_length_5550_cov_4.655109_2_plen_316_part_00
MNQTGNFIGCDRAAPHSKAGCSLINANTTAADCDIANDVHYPSRQAMPAAAQAIMKAAGSNNTEGVVAAMNEANSQQGNADTIVSSLVTALILVAFALFFFGVVRVNVPQLMDLRSDAAWRRPEESMRLPAQAAWLGDIRPKELPRGYIAWLPALYALPDEEFRRQAGYDALVVTRFFVLGAKFCVLCMLPWGFVLVLTYALAGGDRWDCESFSLANMPDRSVLLWCPLLACYGALPCPPDSKPWTPAPPCASRPNLCPLWLGNCRPVGHKRNATQRNATQASRSGRSGCCTTSAKSTPGTGTPTCGRSGSRTTR